MNKKNNQLTLILLSALFITMSYESEACSSFKLQARDGLVYGHNLNQGDIGVPGLIFINKRGMFKIGRSWSELTTPDHSEPSGFSWISRYGSVSFNNFGRDLPDGGMNEAGLFIWEMSESVEYPVNEDLPKLSQMNWMQYILDNCSNLEEAIQCAYRFEIDGWGWHYFIGDATGNTAAISFKKGEVVVHKGENMPVPALFNSPYEREMELIQYFRGFGGEYVAELDNPEVPRFVKTAVMLDEYDAKDDIVDYGLMMLDKLMVNDIPEWSILCDVRKMQVHFKTRINPEIKIISFADIDFSNTGPVMILNMDIAEGGKVIDRFTPYTNHKMREFTENYILPIIPEKFFTSSGISVEEYVKNTSTHTDAAGLKMNQPFVGTWKNKPGEDQEDEIITVIFESKGESITIKVSNDEKSFYDASHLQLISNNLVFTFITDRGFIIEVNASFSGNSMELSFDGIEDHYGRYVLKKVKS